MERKRAGKWNSARKRGEREWERRILDPPPKKTAAAYAGSVL